jgi:hypothetical protein
MSTDTTFVLPAPSRAPARQLRLRIRLRRRRNGEPVWSVARPPADARATAALTAMTRGF